MDDITGIQPKQLQAKPKHLGMRFIRFGVVAGNETVETETVKRDRRLDIRTIDIGQDADGDRHRLHRIQKRSCIWKDRGCLPVGELPLYQRDRISARPEVIDSVPQGSQARLALRDECVTVRSLVQWKDRPGSLTGDLACCRVYHCVAANRIAHRGDDLVVLVHERSVEVK